MHLEHLLQHLGRLQHLLHGLLLHGLHQTLLPHLKQHKTKVGLGGFGVIGTLICVTTGLLTNSVGGINEPSVTLDVFVMVYAISSPIRQIQLQCLHLRQDLEVGSQKNLIFKILNIFL